MPGTPGHSRIPSRMLTCASTGPSIAAYGLLSWWSHFPAPGPGGRPGTPRRYVSPGPRVRDDLVAQVDAFNANRHAGNGDQHVDLRLRFTAETAFQVVAIHRRFPSIAIWHHYQRTGGPQQPRPAEQPALDPVLGLGGSGPSSTRRQVELGATLGATRTNGIAVLRTYPNSGQERARGRALP